MPRATKTVAGFELAANIRETAVDVSCPMRITTSCG
jgi:hypothetical protein